MYPHDALCFLSGLSLIMMVVIRYISKLLVWILTVLVIIGSIGNFHKQHACSSTLNTYPSNSVWHFKNALRIYLSSCLSLLHYADKKKKTVPDVCFPTWTRFCSDLLQGGQPFSGGSMWTTGMPSIITPYQYLGKKWPQTMLRPCLCMLLVLQFSRYVSMHKYCMCACILW